MVFKREHPKSSSNHMLHVWHMYHPLAQNISKQDIYTFMIVHGKQIQELVLTQNFRGLSSKTTPQDLHKFELTWVLAINSCTSGEMNYCRSDKLLQIKQPASVTRVLSIDSMRFLFPKIPFLSMKVPPENRGKL